MASPANRLIAAVKKGDVDATERLLADGVNPDSRDRYDLTALIWAARKGNEDVAKLLLKHGANPNERDKLQGTPLHHAVLFKRKAILRTLVDGGCDLNAKDSFANTALELANMGRLYDIAEILVDLGARGTVRDPGIISIGVVQGGPYRPPICDAIDSLDRHLDKLDEPNSSRERGHLNVVFAVPGPVWKPDYQGVRKGKFSKQEKTLVVQCGVPTDTAAQPDGMFVMDAIRQAIEIAEPVFGRAKTEFAALAISEHLDKLDGKWTAK